MKFLKIIGKITATIFSILLFVIITSTSILFVANRFVNKDNISMVVQEIKLKDITVGKDKNNKNISLEDKINEKYGYDYIDPVITQNILKIPEVNELIGDIAGKYFEYMINARTLPQITDEDIEKIVESDNLDSIFNKKITKKDRNDIKNILHELQFEINDALEHENIEKNFPNIEVFQYLLSDLSILICIMVIIVLITLIIVSNWSIYKSLLWIGIPTIFSALILLFTSVFSTAIVKMAYIENNAISQLLKTVLSKFIFVGLILLLIGIILTVIYSIINNKINKKEEPVEEKEFIGHKFCTNCGAIVTTKFCTNCGKITNNKIDKA